MRKILWRKDYEIRCDKGAFKMFVSSHQSGDFFASLMYYDKTGSLAEDQNVEIDIKFKTFIGDSEEAVYSEGKKWVLDNIDSNAFFVQLMNQNP